MAATWPPFFWVSYGLYRMGLSNIFGVLVAVVSVSALAADPPIPRSNVSVNVNPTTGYYSVTNSTLRLPNGVSVSPSSASVPVVSKYSGGLQQTIPTGITIDAIKKSAPLPAVVRSTTQSVKGAATRCLTSGRCNVGLILAGEGLSRLFDGLDWVMGEGGKVQLASADEISAPPLSSSQLALVNSESASCAAASNLDPSEWSQYISSACESPVPVRKSVGSTGKISGTVCEAVYRGDNLMGYGQWASGRPVRCLYGSGTPFKPPAGRPATESEIEVGVESNYTPEPSDWVALTPELELDDVEITSAPTLQGEPVTTTIFDADGNPHKVTTTNTWYDFDIRDNPSPSPVLDLKTREETETYEDGVLTGRTTTESTASGGAGGAPPPEVDIPTDCDFMPTVCAFLEWFQDDDTPEDPDLSVLLDDRDFTESYTITGGSKQCPPPYELALPFIGQTYYLSFDFACDFASKFYYFVMAAAYIFAAYITIGVARNG